MTFADTVCFAYVVFATTWFTFMLAYFAIRGAQEHLKQSKLGRNIAQDDEALRLLMRKQ